MSVLRLSRRHPRGRHVRDPRRDHRARSRSATGSGSSGRTAPARRRCSGSRPASDEPDRGEVPRKRGLTIGLLAQEAHFDEAFMAAPDLRTAVRARRGPPRARWPSELAALEHDGHVDGARLRRPPAPSSTSSAATRSTSGSTRRCPGLGFARDEWAQAADRRCRAASRPAPRSRGSSSPTPTCSCSTSRPTTSTSTRSSGSRSTSAAGPGRSSWRPTTGRSSTRP